MNMKDIQEPLVYLSTLEIMDFILEKLHQELNNKKDNKDNTSDDNIDISNEKEVLKNYLTKLTKNNNSLISKLFYGLLRYKCICEKCGSMNFAFDHYQYLYFNLITIKNYVLNDKLGNNNSIFLSLNDCLDYFTRTIKDSSHIKDINKSILEKLKINSKKGTINCKNCKKDTKTFVQKFLFSTPPVLPIILERGNDENYFIEELKFPDELNLENYVEYQKSVKKYYLCGVVSNLGKNNNFSKFCTYSRMTPNGKWFCYKNENVSNCTIDDVHQNGVPYLLFYHKIRGSLDYFLC